MSGRVRFPALWFMVILESPIAFLITFQAWPLVSFFERFSVRVSAPILVLRYLIGLRIR